MPEKAKSQKYKIVKIPVYNCKKCGKEITNDGQVARDYSILYSHPWCSLKDYCVECGDEEIEKTTKKQLRPKLTAKIAKFEVERDRIVGVVLITRRGDKIEIRSEGSSGLRIVEVPCRKRK